MILKNYFKSIGLCIGIWLVLAFILNLFNYFDLLSGNLYKVLVLICLITGVCFGSFMLGKNVLNKGLFQGLKYGLVMCFIMFLFSYLAFDISFGFKNVIYFFIVIIVSMIGSVIGINRKKE